VSFMASQAGMALMTGGLSLLGGGGGLFGGDDDDGMKKMLALIAKNTAAAEKDYSPYMSGGQSAQEQMMAQMGLGGPAKAFDVSQLPGYQNSLQQGLNAVNQGGAGAGMLMSGERLKGLQGVGQNVFGDYYNNYLNRLTGMTNQGMSAAGNLANIRTGGMTQQLGLMQQEQQNKSNQFGDLLGLAGTGLGMAFGGPMGAAVGGSLGGMLGGGGGGMPGGGGQGMMLPGMGGAGGTQNSALGMMGVNW
jgi:hypothetical protein